MNHVLVGLAICGALVVYPGGASLAAATAIGRAPGWPGALGHGQRPWRALRPVRWTLAGLLGGLVLMPLPWPGNPVGALAVGGLDGPALGGAPLSIAGLCCLEAIASRGPHANRSRPLTYLWYGGLVLLALASRGATWGALLGAGGAGAEVARLALGLASMLALPWLAGPGPDGDLVHYVLQASRVALGVSLILPQVVTMPIAVLLILWWGTSLVVGAAAAGRRPRLRRWPPRQGKALPAGRI